MESRLLTLIKNLNEVAKCHKNHCQDENCGISLFMIKQVAQELSIKLNNEESLEVLHMKWPG